MTRYRLMTHGPAGTTAHLTYDTRAEALAYLDGRYPMHDREPCPDAPGDYRVDWHTTAWIQTDPPSQECDALEQITQGCA